jgi:hypothetical protein
MNTWNELKYEAQGEERKRMVQIIEQLIGEKAVYLRTPTCSYENNDGTLTIELPKDSMPETALANLDRLIEGKGNLIRKAIGVDNLSYEITEDRVRFLWFQLTGNVDEATAYTRFITKLLKRAQTAKRVTLKGKRVENEKYAFRCFLLRLGFIGDEYKTARKILLKNLYGNSSWKNGQSE